MIAVSPDGSKVLAAVGMRTLEVIRVADAAIEDSLSLDGAAPPGGPPLPHTLMYGGNWRDERVVANSDRGSSFSICGAVCTSSRCSQRPHFRTVSTSRSSWTTRTSRGWADLAEPSVSGVDEPAHDNALVECDLATDPCSVDAEPGSQVGGWVTNPSRWRTRR